MNRKSVLSLVIKKSIADYGKLEYPETSLDESIATDILLWLSAKTHVEIDEDNVKHQSYQLVVDTSDID